MSHTTHLFIPLLLTLCLILPIFSATQYGLISKKDGKELQLLKLASRALVEGPYAQVEFIQTYKNPYEEPIETEFLFPRTETSIFHRFEAIFRNQTIVGKIFEKEEAKAKYEQSIKEGHTAAYSERNANTPDIMKILVGNIPAGETVEIKFSIIQPLDLIANKVWSFTLPVVLTERYGLTPDPSKPQDQPPTITNVPLEGAKYQEWHVEVDVKTGSPFEIVSNPSHNLEPVLTEEASSGSVKIYKANWNATLSPNKNFIVYFKPKEIQDPSVILAEHPDYPNDYTFLVNFVPELNNLNINTITQAIKDKEEGFLRLKNMILERDKLKAKGEFIFIIDRSGSMHGNRIENLKKALKKFLEVLPEDSFFNIVSFGSSYSLYEPNSLKNSPEVRQKVSVWIDSIYSDMGGTEILEPLKAAASLPNIENYPRSVMILTDGDVSSPDLVIQTALDHSKSIRFCTVGIGHGASEYLVKNVAKVGGCVSEFVLDDEDIGDKAIHMVESAVSQHLKDIDLKVECFNDKKTPVKAFSKRVDVILKDRPFQEWVYLQDLKEVSYCKVNVHYFNSLTESYVTKELTIDGFKTPEITDMWHKIAYDGKIKEIDKQVRFGHEEINKEDLKSQIVNVSTKYQILSDYTSFFAVLGNNTVDNEGKPIKVSIDNVDSADYDDVQVSYDMGSGAGVQPMHIMRMKATRLLGTPPPASSYHTNLSASIQMDAFEDVADVDALILSNVDSDDVLKEKMVSEEEAEEEKIEPSQVNFKDYSYFLYFAFTAILLMFLLCRRSEKKDKKE